MCKCKNGRAVDSSYSGYKSALVGKRRWDSSFSPHAGQSGYDIVCTRILLIICLLPVPFNGFFIWSRVSWFPICSQWLHLFQNRTSGINGSSVLVALHSVLWRCWLGGRKGIRHVKNWLVGCWCGYLSGARCRFAFGPAAATATHCLLLQ